MPLLVNLLRNKVITREVQVSHRAMLIISKHRDYLKKNLEDAKIIIASWAESPEHEELLLNSLNRFVNNKPIDIEEFELFFLMFEYEIIKRSIFYQDRIFIYLDLSSKPTQPEIQIQKLEINLYN